MPPCPQDICKISTLTAPQTSVFGINLLGQFSSATGLGNTVRQIAKALQENSIPFAGLQIDPYYPTGDVTSELCDIGSHLVRNAHELSYPVNLYCAPVFDTGAIISQLPPQLVEGRFHAALVWWETTRMNPAWVEELNRLDAVIAFSDFVSEVLANAVQLTPVIRGSHPLTLPADLQVCRADFGVPQDAVVFLSSFDPSGDPTRKNPLATIQAFREAFPRDDAQVRLLFRLNNATATPLAQQTVQDLFEAANGDSRIGFLLNPMTYRQVLSLHGAADVFVSLHRSEGLGLGMLESMRLGVPVIATAWSGNMSFMDQCCAQLVRYRLVEVRGKLGFFQPQATGADARWAEPVMEDAVAGMRLLRASPEHRALLGERGRQRASQYQEQASTMGWVNELRTLWENSAQLPGVRGKFSALHSG
jgi:glycosyltransferase involved in cell wall biosynthesis